MEKQKRRDEIDLKYKWDLSKIFKSDDSFLKELNSINNDIYEIQNVEGHILDNSESLLNYFKISEKLERRIYKLYYYASLKHDEDTTNTKYQEYKGKVDNLISKYSEITSFVTPEMMKKDYNYVLNLINNNKELDKYKFNLENFYRYKEHTLSKNEEEILSKLEKILSISEETFESLTDSDIKFGKIKDENGKYIEFNESKWGVLSKSSNREVRKKAFKLLYKTYSNYKNTLANTFRGNIDVLTKIANIRKYNSSLEASLFDDNISLDIYNNLINTINNNLEPLYDYYKLKKECLNLEELHLYDIYVDLAKEDNKKYTFEEAKSIVIKALEPLGSDYTEIIQKAFDEQWIDVYNNVGKRTGAYSSGFYDTNPYILLNYENKLDDVSTLAHELGHSIHTYLSCQSNTYNNSSYKIFVAEVASTVNEMLLRLYLLNNTNDTNQKLNILNQIMELFKSTIYRQTMFAEFERNMHKLNEKGEVLTHELISKEYYKINEKYFGKDVIIDKEIQYEWMRIPHFYYDFYVYKYSIGLSCAIKIANDIYNQVPGALEKYKNFLKSGGSDYPSNELLIAGIDISKPEVIEDAIKFFTNTINEYKKIIKKDGNNNE